MTSLSLGISCHGVTLKGDDLLEPPAIHFLCDLIIVPPTDDLAAFKVDDNLRGE